MRFLSWLTVAAVVCGAGLARAADDGFKPLFNGKDLSGWVGDKDLWSVENGVIVGTTDNKELKHNSFLATEKPYANFILKAKFKLRNHNSGIQVRSKQFDEYVVRGYQPDIAADKNMGGLYEEGFRGVLAKAAPGTEEHVHNGDWNEYVITCDGPHLKQEINGFTTVDYNEMDKEKGATTGIIALQLHAGPKMRVEFKDVEIKVLPDSAKN